MSDFRAIGGVSNTLSTLLQDRMEIPGSAAAVAVTIGTPRHEKEADAAKAEEARLNIFLYRVTENGYLQNQEIPGQGSTGAFGHPPLSLNLHYLLTGYGSKEVKRAPADSVFDEELSQEVLGSAMRVLHDIPIVSDRLVTLRAPTGRAILDQSLRGSFEAVKLNLEPLSLEDITKIWTALGLRYRLSAAYMVTTVQIESRRPRRYAKPVGEPVPPYPPAPGTPAGPGPNIEVMINRVPTVADLLIRRQGESTERAFSYARIRDTLVLRGTALTDRPSRLEIGNLVAAPAIVGDHLELILPDATLLSGELIPPDDQLQPGVQAVRVLVSDPAGAGAIIPSNTVAFMLVPTVSAVTTPTAARAVTITGVRLIHGASGSETVIGRIVVPQALYSTATPAQIDLTLPETLPSNTVPILLSGPLPASITFSAAAPYWLDVTINGVTTTIKFDLPTTVDRKDVAAAIETAIRSSAPNRLEFARARVALLGTQLVFVAGGAATSIAVGPQAGGSTVAAVGLQLQAGQTTAATNGFLSGSLTPFPALSSANPTVLLTLGGVAAQSLSFARPTYIDDAATKLQAAIVSVGGTAAYTGARVIPFGDQLLLVPGAGASASFAKVLTDATTVAELQLSGRYGVRVRVNGAESIDDVALTLP